MMVQIVFQPYRPHIVPDDDDGGGLDDSIPNDGLPRNPYLWPGAVDSFWNVSIGSGATYVPAGLYDMTKYGTQIHYDGERMGVSPSDPLKSLSGPGVPGGTLVRVPPGMNADGSWNGCATFLDADGVSVWQGQPLRLSSGGNPSWSYSFPSGKQSLYGAMQLGNHGGSGLSGMAGSIRLGDLSTNVDKRFDHCLKINLAAWAFCYWTGSQSTSFRWPAIRCDAYANASQYGGRVPALKMGALLALPPGTDLSYATDQRVRKIAVALMDYGGYVCDDTFDGYQDGSRYGSSNGVHTFCGERGEWPSITSAPEFHAQIMRLMRSLHVVDNNSASNVGGGGTRRRPAVPDLIPSTLL